jgi:hypothetical protein
VKAHDDFHEGLMEPLKGWVKDFKPTNLQDDIWRMRDLGPAAKPKFVPRQPLNTEGRDQMLKSQQEICV